MLNYQRVILVASPHVPQSLVVNLVVGWDPPVVFSQAECQAMRDGAPQL